MRTGIVKYILAAAILCAGTVSCSIFKKASQTNSRTTSIHTKKTGKNDTAIPAPVPVKRTEKPASPVRQKTKGEILADSIVTFAKGYLGVKYRSGGTSRAGFDCSGLVYLSFSHFGIFVPRTSASQYMASKKIDISEIRPGDLAFFNGSHIGRNVGHVAIITETDGNGKFKMIHSTIQRGVMIDNFPEGSYYPPRLVGFGRVLPE
mgnify:CR=1 FL=1